jgi:hypothetical protein
MPIHDIWAIHQAKSDCVPYTRYGGMNYEQCGNEQRYDQQDDEQNLSSRQARNQVHAVRSFVVVARDRIHPASRSSSCVKISVFHCKMRLSGINFVGSKHSKLAVWESIIRGVTRHKIGRTSKNSEMCVKMRRKNNVVREMMDCGAIHHLTHHIIFSRCLVSWPPSLSVAFACRRGRCSLLSQ